MESKYPSKKPKRDLPKSQQKLPVSNVSVNDQKKWIWIALAIVSLTTFVIYYNALSYGFLITWDDAAYITTNSAIRDLHRANIQSFFTEYFVWNYQPITILTYALEYKAAGNSPFLYHFNNIILHVLNTLLVFLLIKNLSPKNYIVALITAAFFAVHPMHVESVAWVSERKDVLYSFFFLISLILYTYYLKTEKLKFLLFSCILFIFSCMSKSAAVILPLVMILFDYYLNRKISWRILVEKIPFFIISLVFGIVAVKSQKTALSVLQAYSVFDHITVVSNSFITYIFKAFLPVNLSAIYQYPIKSGGLLPMIYYMSFVFNGLLLYFVWYSRRWGKVVIFGFLFFILTIILVMQIIAVGDAAMADRYTYIPFIGIFFIIGKLCAYLSSGANVRYTYYLLVPLILGFVVFSSLSYERVKKWENDNTLFSDAINKNPFSTTAYINRGSYYLDLAQNKYNDNSQKKEVCLINAVKDFDKLVELDKNNSYVYKNRGIANFYLHDYYKAINDFDLEIVRNSKAKGAYFYRALAKNAIKDYTGAVRDFNKTLELDPGVADVYFNRGNAKKELRDFTGALNDWSKAIELNPKMIKAYNNRSFLLCTMQDYEGTLADYDKMIELNPQDTIVIKNRKIIQALLESKKN